MRRLDTKGFSDLIAETERPVLVEFWAPWCTYCRRLAPAVEELEQRYGQAVLFAGVNIDEEPGLEEQEGIELVPTLRAYRGGRLLGELVAPESKAQLQGFLADLLKGRLQGAAAAGDAAGDAAGTTAGIETGRAAAGTDAKAKTGSAEEAGAEGPLYDLVVVGGGPAGYTAALYAARAGLKTLVLEMLSAGGQMALTHTIDNYPGFEQGVEGFELGRRMQLGAERFGAETRLAQVQRLQLAGPVKTACTDAGPFLARTLVLATGAAPRLLGVEGEKELTGKGVHYCAACDGMFYKGKTVAVVGGGNSAAEDALALCRICKKVYLIHRRDSLRATKIYHEPLQRAQNLTFCWDRVVSGLQQQGGRLCGVTLQDTKTGGAEQLVCDGLFVSVGRSPSSDLVKGQLALDPAGYVLADESTRTGLPGVFVAGDLRAKALRQIVTAVADGAMAAYSAQEYLAAQGG